MSLHEADGTALARRLPRESAMLWSRSTVDAALERARAQLPRRAAILAPAEIDVPFDQFPLVVGLSAVEIEAGSSLAARDDYPGGATVIRLTRATASGRSG